MDRPSISSFLAVSVWGRVREQSMRARQGIASTDWNHAARAAVTAWGRTALELAVIAVAAIVFANPVSNLDPQVRVGGGDYSMTVQFHTVWLYFQKCGLCFFWNGSLNGGGPAFADLFPSSLHPLVAITTLLWGVVPGSKIALLGVFVMAGVAQWWLARTLGLGLMARMWSGLMAVVAGSIAGRMQMGWFGVALGTASAALAFAPLVQVGLTGSRRAAILLGIAVAFAAAAGQGYMQLGLLAILPLAAILVPWGTPEARIVLRRYGVAVLVALLVGAPFLLPVLLNLNQFTKSFSVNLEGIQPFYFILLNFVLPTVPTEWRETLRMDDFPALYVNYIGWLTVLFAFIGVRMARAGKEARVMLFLVAAAFVAIFLASLEPRNFLLGIVSHDTAVQIQSLRSSPVIAGLAVVPLLGLAAIGIDRLASRIDVNLTIGLSQGLRRPLSVSLRWLLLIPLVYGFWSVASANQGWLSTQKYSPSVVGVAQALKTASTQWVQPPFGDSDYLIQAELAGLKISKYPLSWGWKDREVPQPLIQAENKWDPENTTLIGPIEGAPKVNLYRGVDANEYAQVVSGDTVTNCTAQAVAGDIDVQCNAAQAGLLLVKENNWAGWGATLDGQGVALEPSQQLSIQIPAGAHTVQFRYRPLDGILGFLLGGVGLALCVYLWRKPDALPHAPAMALS